MIVRARRPTWKLVSNAVLLVIGLVIPVTGQTTAAPDESCPGLASYMSKPYATDKGARRRCDLLREIERDGGLSSHPLRERLFQELSNRFAVRIEFNGDVELPGRAVDYLLDNMPEAAALVSAYTNKEYRATQADATPGPKSFFVTNNQSFAAEFTFLYSHISPAASQHMFFESGHAQVLFWKIWGNSFVRYNLRKNADGTVGYDIKVHVFTDSRLLRTVLDSALFGYFAHRMFKGILSDIESAVHRFAEDPNRLFFFEQWTDRQALLSHFAVPASGAFVEAISKLATGTPTLEIYEASVASL